MPIGGISGKGSRVGGQLPVNRHYYPLRGVGQRGVVEMDVAIGRGHPSVSEQASRDVQAFAVHDGVGGVRVSQVSNAAETGVG